MFIIYIVFFILLLIQITNSIKMNIRQVKINDLPYIHDLIRQSYLAMIDHAGEESKEKWLSGAEDSIKNDLSEENFASIYTLNYGCNFFVATLPDDDKPIGCVALKRHSQDEAELCRMAVDTSIRSTGIGSLLVNHLLEYAKDTGVLRISLVTANPLAAKFYSKKNFSTYHSFQFPIYEQKFLTVFKMIYYIGEKIIRNVHIIGGTHGNERIGVELIKNYFESEQSIVMTSTMKTTCIIGNIEAVKCNRRYIDVDMNRQFLNNDLEKEILNQEVKSEEIRARELNMLLGPKGSIKYNCNSDFIIDLHSSNSAVGIVCMISGENDIIALRIASKLQKKYFPDMKITCSLNSKKESWSVDSITENGLSIEVGPLPHGTVNYNLFEITKNMVIKILDEIEERNIELEKINNKKNDYGRDIVYRTSSSESSIIAPIENFQSIVYYTFLERVYYPHEGKYFVHPNIEGKDWLPINLDTIVLISIDGKKELTLNDIITSKDVKKDVYPLFINEAAYQESNVIFAIYTKKERYIP